MPLYADLLSALYDIDAHRGKVCRSCLYYNKGWNARGEQEDACKQGYGSFSGRDGCDDWEARSEPEQHHAAKV
ncbi:MAG TPA: hypothetical protein VHT52_17835 [Stellaceae bacterium]|jgi:hypothetical protein|nr:hypothetical protein [Stellaceae bacterium]